LSGFERNRKECCGEGEKKYHDEDVQVDDRANNSLFMGGQ
jgi:hypothetical protein